MTDPVIATEPSLQPVVAGSPSTDLAAKLAEMETRVAGLQTAMNRKAADLQTALAQVAESNTVRNSLATQIAEATTREAALTTDNARLASDAATSKDGLERLREIARHGAVLLEHEEQGLLRVDLKGPEFSTFLDLYAAKVGAQITQTAVDRTAGTAPVSGASRTAAAATPKVLMDQMRALEREGKGKTKEHDALHSAWAAMQAGK